MSKKRVPNPKKRGEDAVLTNEATEQKPWGYLPVRSLLLLVVLSGGAVINHFQSPGSDISPSDKITTRTRSSRPPQKSTGDRSTEKNASSRRRFLRYDPSPWEVNWTTHIDEWTADRVICERILEQKEQLHIFLSRACTSFIHGSAWCLHDDGYVKMYYDTAGRVFSTTLPSRLANRTISAPPRPFVPTADEESVFSKFTFRDDATGTTFTEYIEPLVSHLRHPLARCLPGADGLHSAAHPFRLSLGAFRGHVVPYRPRPAADSTHGHHRRRRFYYFDGGASSWSEGLGGPSLSVLTELWRRNGIEFDEIRAYEAKTKPYTFYKSVPANFQSQTTYSQVYIATSYEESVSSGRPFVPSIIREIKQRENNEEESYVLFKLDIDTPSESDLVDHLLAPDNDDAGLIDEFVWEHHVSANYLMMPLWGPHASSHLKMSDSYAYFAKLRRRGIRAHSWV